MPRRNRQRAGRPGDRRWGSPRKRPTRDERREASPLWPRDRHPDGRADALRFDLDNVPGPALLPSPPVEPVCGACREWYADESGGRGTCAHPGSGFLKPWSDTPACPFFTRL